jgi:hypothetical protein
MNFLFLQVSVELFVPDDPCQILNVCIGPNDMSLWTQFHKWTYQLQCGCDSATTEEERTSEMVKCPSTHCQRYYHRKCFVDKEPFKYGPCYDCKDDLKEIQASTNPAKDTTPTRTSHESATTSQSEFGPSPPKSHTKTPSQAGPPPKTPPPQQQPTFTSTPTDATNDIHISPSYTPPPQPSPPANVPQDTQYTTDSAGDTATDGDQTDHSQKAPSDGDDDIVTIVSNPRGGQEVLDALSENKPPADLVVAPYQTGRNRDLTTLEIIQAFEAIEDNSVQPLPLYWDYLGLPEPGDSYLLTGIEGLRKQHVIGGWLDLYAWKGQGELSTLEASHGIRGR